MKLIKSIVMAGAMLLLAQSVASAQPPGQAAAPSGDLKGLGVGLVTLGAALGIGILAKGAFESMARQPEIEGNIRGGMVLIAAFIEGFTFFALVIVLIQVLLGR
jgi:F-type H+-transporting ATPase subunit c